MRADIVPPSTRRYITVAVDDGHEFQFEAPPNAAAHPAKLFAERWKHRRLPLNAALCRQVARAVAEARFRDQDPI